MTLGSRLEFERLAYEPASWDAIVDGLVDSEVYHSSAWLSYLHASQGADPVIAAVHDAGRHVGYFVGAVVRKYGIRILGSPMVGWGTPRMGFLLPPDVDRGRAADALIRFAFSEVGCHQIELAGNGLTEASLSTSGYRQETGRTFHVDITGTEDAVMSRMSSRTRNLIRRAARVGLVAEITDDPAFANEYQEQMRDVFGRQGLSPTYGVERVRALIKYVHPSGQLLMLRVRAPDGPSVATILVVGRNRTAVLWGAAFLRDHSSLHPTELLHWEAIRYWRERGMSRYDMGGGGDYKAKFGAVVEPWYHFYRSRYPGLGYGRAAFRSVAVLKQRLGGRAARATVDTASAAPTGDPE